MKNLAIDLLEDTLSNGKCFLEYFPTLQNYIDKQTYDTVFHKALEQVAHIELLLAKIEEYNILGESND